jgi:hypothetical protein
MRWAANSFPENQSRNLSRYYALCSGVDFGTYFAVASPPSFESVPKSATGTLEKWTKAR